MFLEVVLATKKYLLLHLLFLEPITSLPELKPPLQAISFTASAVGLIAV